MEEPRGWMRARGLAWCRRHKIGAAVATGEAFADDLGGEGYVACAVGAAEDVGLDWGETAWTGGI